MDSVSPVWTEALVAHERIIALDQPQYLPIVVLPVQFSDGTSGLSVRFRLTDEERFAIARGADVVITEMTFGRPFTPISVKAIYPNTSPYEEAAD